MWHICDKSWLVESLVTPFSGKLIEREERVGRARESRRDDINIDEFGCCNWIGSREGGRGKGYMRQGGVEINVGFGLSCVSKHRRGKEIINGAKSKEIHASLVISIKVDKEVDEGFDDQMKLKLKDVETIAHVVQSLMDLKKGSMESREESILQKIPKGLGEARGEPTQPSHKKHSHDDHDPPENYKGDTKIRRMNIGGSSSKKGKAHQESSNYETFVDVDEPQQEREVPSEIIGEKYA
uniref:Uncharacterized protein n=1 Tax=Tanacetum cinerariifolium TaxID=118510 RepID=A0A6L2N7A7_TANCI|nr:hypothetical protein [Tanacetum cinerariifolium]